MKKRCKWCGRDSEIQAMESAATMKVICRDCGGGVGEIDYKDLKKIIDEYHYWRIKHNELLAQIKKIIDRGKEKK